jgi:hypothetical protein
MEPETRGAPSDPSLAPLGREEYIEQAHFFQTFAERTGRNVPAQELLAAVREEILATTKLPLAIDFMLAELRHTGVISQAMRKLGHYFTAFQAFLMEEAENDRSRFDLRIALAILKKEAEYRAAEPTHQGLFLFQFEVLCRNRLGYDRGLTTLAEDPAYDAAWRRWIFDLRHQVGVVDFADLIYVRSEYYVEMQSRSGKPQPALPALFGEREGRIALANRRKDPLYLFASLHRQLGYPDVPRQQVADREQYLLPSLARRMEHLETRVKLLEEEFRGGIDITKFYGPQRPDSLRS